MEEKRKSNRRELDSRIILKKLGDDNDSGQEVAIEVLDVSKTGIGFMCTIPLMIGAVYESYLTIWTKEVIHAFIEIVRIVKEDDDLFHYGGIFIGMPEMDLKRIEIYDQFQSSNE